MCAVRGRPAMIVAAALSTDCDDAEDTLEACMAKSCVVVVYFDNTSDTLSVFIADGGNVHRILRIWRSAAK